MTHPNSMPPTVRAETDAPPPRLGDACMPSRDGASPQPTGQALRRTSSERLFSGHRELEIEHAGALYRLRITATGKLILTK